MSDSCFETQFKNASEGWPETQKSSAPLKKGGDLK
jgi:hypothetical protein